MKLRLLAIVAFIYIILLLPKGFFNKVKPKDNSYPEGKGKGINRIKYLFDMLVIYLKTHPYARKIFYNLHKHKGIVKSFKLIKKVARIFEGIFFRLREVRREKNVQVPSVLFLDASSKCNLSCEGCYANDKNHEKLLPNYKDLVKTINNFQQCGCRLFLTIGGEPLINKDIFKVFAEFRWCYFLVFTNGTLMDDGIIDRIDKLPNVFFFFSLDGDEEQTDQRRGKGVYRQVVDNMRKFDNRKIPYGISITLHKSNAQLCTDEGFLNKICGEECRGVLYADYISKSPGSFLEQVDPAGLSHLVGRVNSLREYFSRFWIVYLPHDEFDYICGRMCERSIIGAVSADGTYKPCVFSDRKMGNIFKEDFFSVLGNIPEIKTSDNWIIAREYAPDFCHEHSSESKIVEEREI